MPRTFVWHRTRGPKHTPKQEPAGTGQLQIKQVKSEIGHSWRIRRTLEAIGEQRQQMLVRLAVLRVRVLQPIKPVLAGPAVTHKARFTQACDDDGGVLRTATLQLQFSLRDRGGDKNGR